MISLISKSNNKNSQNEWQILWETVWNLKRKTTWKVHARPWSNGQTVQAWSETLTKWFMTLRWEPPSQSKWWTVSTPNHNQGPWHEGNLRAEKAGLRAEAKLCKTILTKSLVQDYSRMPMIWLTLGFKTNSIYLVRCRGNYQMISKSYPMEEKLRIQNGWQVEDSTQGKDQSFLWFNRILWLHLCQSIHTPKIDLKQEVPMLQAQLDLVVALAEVRAMRWGKKRLLKS